MTEQPKKLKPRPQMRISAWIEGIPEPVHDCAFDIIYIRNGVTPPCKLPPTDPYYEPIK